MKAFLHWTFPGAFLFLLAFFLKAGFGPEGLMEGVVSGYPWAVYGTTFFLAVFFHRSRVAVAALALAATAWIGATQAGGFTAFYFAGGLLALLLGATALLNDRGLFTTPGLLQVGGVAVVAFFGALFMGVAPEDMAAFMAAMPLPASLTVWSGFPQPVFVAFALAIPISPQMRVRWRSSSWLAGSPWGWRWWRRLMPWRIRMILRGYRPDGPSCGIWMG